MATDSTPDRRPAESQEAENLRFRRFLRAHHVSDNPLHLIAEQHLNACICTSCGNCCRETRVVVSPLDIDAIAHHLQMKPDDLMRSYTVHDSESVETLLGHEHGGCIFLHSNLCLIYEARPRACRDFPPIASRQRLLGSRMSSVSRQAAFCPIVAGALEEYKKLVGFRH
jgi:uncharacterized protein